CTSRTGPVAAELVRHLVNQLACVGLGLDTERETYCLGELPRVFRDLGNSGFRAKHNLTPLLRRLLPGVVPGLDKWLDFLRHVHVSGGRAMLLRVRELAEIGRGSGGCFGGVLAGHGNLRDRGLDASKVPAAIPGSSTVRTRLGHSLITVPFAGFARL